MEKIAKKALKTQQHEHFSKPSSHKFLPPISIITNMFFIFYFFKFLRRHVFHFVWMLSFLLFHFYITPSNVIGLFQQKCVLSTPEAILCVCVWKMNVYKKDKRIIYRQAYTYTQIYIGQMNFKMKSKKRRNKVEIAKRWKWIIFF